jgi:hypothetical protein
MENEYIAPRGRILKYKLSLQVTKAAKEQVKQVEKELDTQMDVVKQTEVSRTTQISTIKENSAPHA